MKKVFMMGAAIALLGGTAWAQMQGSPTGQNMNQQMQNMEQENPHGLHHRAPAGSQTGPSGGQDLRQNTDLRGQSGVSTGHLSPTKSLPAEQKTRIRATVIESSHAPRIDNVNFTLRVGAPIPRSVRVVPVPEEIVAIYPEWSGFLYFVSGDEIIIVDPNSYAVVGVLEA